MSCRPIPPAHIIRAIRNLDWRLDIRWIMTLNNWTVWYRPAGRAPYMLMRVQNDDHTYRPLDRRTVNHLRYLLWFNRNPVRSMYEQHTAEEYAHEKREAAYEDDAYRMGLEMYPAVDALARQSGHAWSAKPRVHAPGFGPGQAGVE